VGLGLEGVVAVAMPDAVLVADKSRAQDVKAVVDTLRAAGVEQADDYPRFHRPWGWYETLCLGTRFQVKRIMVKPGGVLSLQSHHHRSEHWIVVAGTAEVTMGEETKLVTENESVYIPLGTSTAWPIPAVADVSDRGPDRLLSRRGRYRPLRGRLQPDERANAQTGCG
jgi:mannose-1-phosphate guanylyltransferase/mannose-6-phosphate isomerase